MIVKSELYFGGFDDWPVYTYLWWGGIAQW
jgi:hypothetical protein